MVGSLFGVQLVNSGKVPFTVTEIYILLGRNDGAERRLYMPALATGQINGVRLPSRLDPGDTRSFVQAREQLHSDLREQGFEEDTKLIVVAKDSLGNSYDASATFNV
jgi:hypothetical protein